MQINKLQIIIIGGAVVLAVIAVLIFSGIIPGLKTGNEDGVSLIFWGFDDEDSIRDAAQKYSESHQGFAALYSKKDISTFESDLLNALAGGPGAPDIIVFPSDYLEKHKDKLAPAPPILATEREIKQNFVDSASAFLGAKNEVLGVPLYADALALYINNDLLANKFITLPPKTWDEFLDGAGKLTQKDGSGNVIISGAALGRALNIENASLILTTLFLQSGEKIIGNEGTVVLGSSASVGGTALNPAESALRFFIDFANPQKTSRSWSAALPEAKDMFISGKLAMYLGGVSEYNEIKRKNTHLNFSISALPRLAGEQRLATGGSLYALAVPKASAKQRQAWNFITFLASTENSSAYADKTGGVSLRRDVLPKYQKESARSVFAESVLALRLWPNPDPQKTEQIFREMIEDAALNRLPTLRDSLEKAKARLEEL